MATPRKKPHKIRKPPASLPGLLASGRSFVSIGEQLGVDRETISAWSKLPNIQTAIEQIRREASQQAVARLQALVEPAVDQVGRILTGDACELCGRPRAEDKDVLKAAEFVGDRGGLPKTQRQEISGSVGVDLDTSAASTAQLEAEIVQASIEILIGWGNADLADHVREALHGQR